MTLRTQQRDSRKPSSSASHCFETQRVVRVPPFRCAYGGPCGRSWPKYSACAQYRAYDGRSQRGSDVACANFGDLGRHRVRKVAAGHRVGAPFFRGDHLGRQHAGECRIRPDSRRGSPMRLGRPRALFSNLFIVREETRGRRREGAAFFFLFFRRNIDPNDLPRFCGWTGKGDILDWT